LNKRKGILFVVSGPSGTGKGTIMKEYFKKYPEDNTFLSISMTSRAPRPGDEEGVTYYFKTREEFLEARKNGELIESTEFCGNFYGTPKKPVYDMLEAGKDIVLEIEVDGGSQVKRDFENAVGIFILPPSIEELKRRLLERNTESKEDLEKRIARAMKEFEEIDKYDYFVINDNLQEAVETFRSIIIGETQKIYRNKKIIEEVCK